MDYHSVIVGQRIRHLDRYLDHHFPFLWEPDIELYERVSSLNSYTFWKTTLAIIGCLLMSAGVWLLVSQWQTFNLFLKVYLVVTVTAGALFLITGCCHLYDFWAWKKFCQGIKRIERIARQLNLDPIHLRKFPGYVALRYRVLLVAHGEGMGLLCEHALTELQKEHLPRHAGSVKILEDPQVQPDVRAHLGELIDFFYDNEESMLTPDLASWLDAIERYPETSDKPY